MLHKEIKRGEIYYFDFGLEKESVQSGRRPILALQSDIEKIYERLKAKNHELEKTEQQFATAKAKMEKLFDKEE